MSYPNIAFIGKARSGKDTAGQHLVRRYAYTRLAFADPLKGALLRTDPRVPIGGGVYVRLEALIRDAGWEYAKDQYPEVRRLLQAYGQAIRELDPEFWIAQVLRWVDAAAQWNLPVVITDCRYQNEASALRDAGFRLVRIKRPDLTTADTHPSETELDDYPVDDVIVNSGTLADLHSMVDLLV